MIGQNLIPEEAIKRAQAENLKQTLDSIKAKEKEIKLEKELNELFQSREKNLEKVLDSLKLIDKAQSEIVYADIKTGQAKRTSLQDFKTIYKKYKDQKPLNATEEEVMLGLQAATRIQGQTQQSSSREAGLGTGQAAGLGAILGSVLGGGKGASEGGIGGILGHLGAHKLGIPFVGPLVGTFIKGIATSPIGLSFAALELGKMGAADYRAQLQSGRITGEGAGAGISAALHAVKLGINPFDLISMQTALAIENGVRAQGFRDKFANAISDTVGDVVNKTGIDYKQAIDLVTVAVRQGNESLSSFRGSIQDISNIAKESSTGVENLVQSITDILNVAQQGGGPSGVREALLTGTVFAKTFGNIAGLGAAGGKIISEAAVPLVGMAGLPTYEAFTAKGQQATVRVLDQLLPMMLKEKPTNMSLEDYAAFQANVGPLHQLMPSATASQILAMFKHYGKPGAATLGKSLQARQAAALREAASTAARFAREKVPETMRAVGKGFVMTPNPAAAHKGEEAFITSLHQGLKNAGLNASEIDNIMKPLRKAYYSGDTSAFNKDIAGLTSSGKSKSEGSIVRLGLTPEARKLFKVEGVYGSVTKYNQLYNGGNGQSQR